MVAVVVDDITEIVTVVVEGITEVLAVVVRTFERL
jgi:hypothetical protein